MSNKFFGCKKFGNRVGVLIAQLGTPAAPTKQALRPYLKQFLSDRRVIEKNPIVWWFILNGIILTLRPKKSAALYSRIWTDQGSPLLLYTKSQAEGVQKNLAGQGYDLEVEYGMRYGAPSLESALDSLIDKGCSRILLFPMYPQYSASTTASTYDAVFPHLLKRRFVPTLRVVEPYWISDEYIDALATVTNESIKPVKEQLELVLLSYHGVPEEYVEKGDPYCCMCTETTAALRSKLDFSPDKIMQTYQSRFGRDPWLVPYTDETIEALGKGGVKRIAIAAPGFTADCLETLDEMGNEARELFEEHGGEMLHLIPCLNDHPAWIKGMSEIVKRELGTWLEEQKVEFRRPQPCPVKVAKAS